MLYICGLIKILSHASAKKKKKKGFGVSTGFQLSLFYWSFSSDIMAVKGLTSSVGTSMCPGTILRDLGCGWGLGVWGAGGDGGCSELVLAGVRGN